MPQFEVEFYISQVFWSAISFIILYLYIRYVFLSRISKSVSDRSSIIDGNDKSSEDLKEKIQSLDLGVKFSINKAKEDAANILKLSQDTGAEKLASSAAEFDSYAEDILFYNNTRLIKLSDKLDSFSGNIADDFTSSFLDIVIKNRC